MSRLNAIRTGDPAEVIEALTGKEADPAELKLAMLNAMQRFEGVYRELAELRAEIERKKGDER